MLQDFGARQYSNNVVAIAIAGKKELNLALEIADILDELNMLLLLLEKQSSVLDSLQEPLREMKPADPTPRDAGWNHIQVVRTKANAIKIIQPTNMQTHVDLQDVHAKELQIGPESFNEANTAFKTIGGQAGVWIQEAVRSLRVQTSSIERLRNEAKQTHKMVRNIPCLLMELPGKADHDTI
jgi:hypothetical protein